MLRQKLDYHEFKAAFERARARAYSLDELQAIQTAKLKQQKLADDLYNQLVDFVNDYIAFWFDAFIKEATIAKSQGSEPAIVYAIEKFAKGAKKLQTLSSLSALKEQQSKTLTTQIQSITKTQLKAAKTYIGNEENPAIRYGWERAEREIGN